MRKPRPQSKTRAPWTGGIINCRRTRLQLVSAAIAALHLAGSPPCIAQAPPQESGTAARQREDVRLAAFFEEVFQRDLARSPMLQARIGIKGADYGKWDDASDAEAVRRNDYTRADLARLRADFDPDALSERSKVSYRIFEFLAQRAR